MSSDLKKSNIYSAIRWYRAFRLIDSLENIFNFLAVVSFIVFAYFFLFNGNVERNFLPRVFGFFLIFLSLTVLAKIKISFFKNKLSKPGLRSSLSQAAVDPERINVYDFFCLEAARAFYHVRNTNDVLSNLVNDNSELKFIFNRLLLHLDALKDKLKEGAEDDINQLLVDSLRVAQRRDKKRVEAGDVLIALADRNKVLYDILFDAEIKLEDFENVVLWLETIKERYEESKKFGEWDNMIKKGTLAREWTSGYTITLDRFSNDLDQAIRLQGCPEIVGHSKEVEAVERILARREINNCLLVGDPEVGKNSVVLALTRKSYLGKSLPEINFKRVVQLDMPALVSGTSGTEQAEAILDRIFQETISAGNVILVIDNFHDFIGVQKKPGLLDISGVISPYLPMPEFQIIALTDYVGLHEKLEEKPGIISLFEKVEVSEISDQETYSIVQDLVFYHEKKQKIFISFLAIKKIIDLAGNYFNTPFPKSATDLLDEVVTFSSLKKIKVVLPEHVVTIVSEKTEIPLGDIQEKEKSVLLNLEQLLHQRIINQEEGVKEVAAALRRSRAEITSRKKPMGTFLFLGPTGVGKTETAKALAEIYFGSEEKMIRLDMSEFQAVTDVPRLIGETGSEGLLTTPVRENPFSLILLDEIEKAHPNILNLFLQVLDEGHLTDGLGRKVDFKHSIIIATSNAGYQIILQAIKENADWSGVKEKILNYLFEKGTFRPEFINRFDAMVVFKPLSQENLLAISDLMLKKIYNNLKEKGIEFIITPELKSKIVELGYDPTFGAREMKRIIQDKVENVLASGILSGEIKRKDKIEINSQEFTLKVHR